MVDVNKTEQLFKKYFEIEGTYKIDSETGVVNVQGNVILLKNTNSMPVQFGRVSGIFSCHDKELISLAGAPVHVGGNFACSRNHLTSLAGAPANVGGRFSCFYNQLTSLAGAPDHVGGEFIVTYGKDLPLLRLCVYNNVRILDGPNEVKSIMKKNAGQGKPGALKAAAELIRAGYPENARW